MDFAKTCAVASTAAAMLFLLAAPLALSHHDMSPQQRREPVIGAAA